MNPSQGSCKGGRGLPPGFPRRADSTLVSGRESGIMCLGGWKPGPLVGRPRDGLKPAKPYSREV